MFVRSSWLQIVHVLYIATSLPHAVSAGITLCHVISCPDDGYVTNTQAVRIRQAAAAALPGGPSRLFNTGSMHLAHASMPAEQHHSVKLNKCGHGEQGRDVCACTERRCSTLLMRRGMTVPGPLGCSASGMRLSMTWPPLTKGALQLRNCTCTCAGHEQLGMV